MNTSFKRNRLAVAKTPLGRNVDFVLFAKYGDKMAYSSSITLTVLDEKDAGSTISPAFTLSPEEVQELMDELWQIGFRPSEGTGSAGALAATQKHLEDMRKLVFEHLGIK